MTTLDLQVAAGADDAQENGDGAGFTSVGTTLTARSDTLAGTRRNCGFRFAGVTIAAGSTISVAYVSVNPDTNDDANLDIFLNDVDDAADFSTEADINSRARTTASTPWVADNLGSSEVNSPSIVSAVQEYIDRPGRVSGNDLVVLFIARSDVSKILRIDSFDGAPSTSPKLHIEYTAPAGGGWGQLLSSKRNKVVMT